MARPPGALQHDPIGAASGRHQPREIPARRHGDIDFREPADPSARHGHAAQLAPARQLDHHHLDPRPAPTMSLNPCHTATRRRSALDRVSETLGSTVNDHAPAGATVTHSHRRSPQSRPPPAPSAPRPETAARALIAHNLFAPPTPDPRPRLRAGTPTRQHARAGASNPERQPAPKVAQTPSRRSRRLEGRDVESADAGRPEPRLETGLRRLPLEGARVVEIVRRWQPSDAGAVGPDPAGAVAAAEPCLDDDAVGALG
jgi:hypothetical protein